MMAACLLLQTTEFSIHSIIELSEFELLICCLIKNGGYLIYYNQFKAFIVYFLQAKNFVVASGSTAKTVFVVQNYPKNSFTFAIKDNKVENVKNVNLDIETYEEVENLVFLENLQKVYFTTNNGSVYSKVLTSEYRSKIALDLDGEKCINMCFYRPKSYILIKTPNKLRIFSSYLQIIHTMDLSGILIIGKKGFNDTDSFLLLESDNLINLQIDYGKQNNKNLESFTNQTLKIKESSFIVSQTFIPRPQQKKKSPINQTKYDQFINKIVLNEN